MSITALKIIALLSMLLDHTMKVLPFQPMLVSAFGMTLKSSYALMRILEPFGRLAFPIFAFSVAEGCKYTHDPKKYLLRLFLAGVISEIPFQLAFNPTLGIRFAATNVFFTLFLGAIACMLYNFCRSKKKGQWTALSAAALLLLMYIAQWMDMDYGWYGVACVLILYAVDNRLLKCALVMVLSGLLYFGMSQYIANLVMVLCSLLLICLYSGKRGRGFKWLFYVFYPAHLVLLYGLGKWMWPLVKL